MGISGVSETGLGNLGAISDKKKGASDKEDAFARRLELIERANAPIERKQLAEAVKGDAVRQRILEVGMERFVQEQTEVKKLMKVMKLVREEADEKSKEVLDKVIEHFEQNPAKNVSEIYDYLAEYVEALPPDAAKRIEQLIVKIKQLMDVTDDTLERYRRREGEGPE
jgi:maltooligosyltrehalose synthase